MNFCVAAGLTVSNALVLGAGVFVQRLHRGTLTTIYCHSVFHFTELNRLLIFNCLHVRYLFVLQLPSEIGRHRVCHNSFDWFLESWLLKIVFSIDIAER